jgi:hypothetical protein
MTGLKPVGIYSIPYMCGKSGEIILEDDTGESSANSKEETLRTNCSQVSNPELWRINGDGTELSSSTGRSHKSDGLVILGCVVVPSI